jgi:hypothetical protein
MKTKAITPNGIIHVTRIGPETYRLTHHSLPTQVVRGEAALVKVIGYRDDGEIEITLKSVDGATLRLSHDTRHGEAGWRASRYVSGIWDEWYLFFENLSGAIEATGGDPDRRNEAIRIARSAF